MNMIKILGAYRVENHDNVNLVEIESGDADLDFGEIAQEIENKPRSNWQVAYDEVLLNVSGTEVVDTQNQSVFRSAFFFHFLDINKPLIVSSIAISLPAITEMPERLKKIVKYYPVD